MNLFDEILLLLQRKNNANKTRKVKKIVLPIVILLLLLLLAGAGYLYKQLNAEKEANREMKEIAELNKQEMENEYERFAMQYSEMKTQINNDSIVEQLTQEQLKTQRLLKELQQVKSTDAREIMRLKKELETVRAVLRSYVLEIDSLNRLNENLKRENQAVKTQYAEATRQIEGLSSEKASLSEKVAIASQLDATGIQLLAKRSNGKEAKKVKDCKQMQVSFNISRNPTARSGMRDVYVRITNPAGNTLGRTGSFHYENKTLQCTMHKTVEYNGEETPVTTYWQVNEFLEAGTYRVSIFVDGNMIGSRSFTLN